MNGLKDSRVLIAAATGAALLAAILVAVFLIARPSNKTPPPQNAQRGMLQVEMGKGQPALDPAKPLRCFVNGQFVGEATLADCARRNGVSAQNLDVGVDPSGQVAASGGPDATALAPLPEVEAPAPAPAPRPQPAAPTSEPAEEADGTPVLSEAACLAFSGGRWRPVGEGLSLRQCTHALYDNRCVRPGEALYARYGAQTLRLVPGRVEVSGDNRSFRFLVGQTPDCALER